MGRISQRSRERDLEDLFRRYGRLRYCELKLGYAFIDFDDERDAEDAVRALDGYELDGSRLIVEWSRGPRSGGGGGRAGPPQRSEYRALVDNMPRDMSWQDLKDCFREAGEVVFADVFRDRSGTSRGIVEFRSRDDLRHAIRRLDDHEVRGSRLRVKEDRGRSRSRSRSPRRSPDRRSRRDSRSPPSRKRGRSGERSPRDRSPRDRSPRKSSRDDREKRRRSPSPSSAPTESDNKKVRSPSPSEADKERRNDHSPSPKRSRRSGSPSPAGSRSPSREAAEDRKRRESEERGGDKEDQHVAADGNGRENDDDHSD